MKVLVVGSGGREHALVWKLAQSPKVSQIYCAPGNGGISQIAQCIPLAADDLEGLAQFALTNKIDLTVVGPEAPLVLGIADVFRAKGLRIFAPTSQGAAIEGSKSLAKELMFKYQVPTAQYRVFTHGHEAKEYIKAQGVPCVVKADGLAAGKGVVVAQTLEEALEAVDHLLDLQKGQENPQLVIEEFLEGEEVTVMAFTDGKTVKPMVWAQDHKRVFDGDQGPNTGGMGAYSPPKVYDPTLEKEIMTTILEPIIAGLAQEGRYYQGVIYAGLMLTQAGPKVLEFNARFGDPETQPVLMLLETDLVEIIEAILDERLEDLNITWRSGAAACVVLASGGYPGTFEKGFPIEGLEAAGSLGVEIFHAGTRIEEGKFVTNGGRVLGVTAVEENLEAAVKKVYKAVEKISFKNMHYRKDIAARSL